MKYSIAFMTLAAGFFASTAVLAQPQSAAPAGSTGLCKDGSYSSNATKSGACAGHKGVKEWYSNSTTATTSAKTTAPAAVAAPAKSTMVKPASATATAVTTPASMATPAKAMTTKAAAPAKTAIAAGGGVGQVWVNAESHVYHCAGTTYYGKTKQGQYMAESAAIAAGNHANHGKKCAS